MSYVISLPSGKLTQRYKKNMTPNKVLKTILTDLKAKLSDEFDRNFERKAFFDKKWSTTKIHNSRGSLMMRTGMLRQSIQARVENNGVHFSSSLPYAEIHNQGGNITVTKGMKAYFWAMYYRASNKGKTPTTQAQQYKALALKRVGDTITIPQRQFIGHHPQVDSLVKNVVNRNITEFLKSIKPKNK